MKNLTGQIIAAIAIHLFITISMFFDTERIVLRYILSVFVVANAIGIFMICNNKVILGAKIFMISSFGFIPIGLLGIIGARNIITKTKEIELYNKTYKK